MSGVRGRKAIEVSPVELLKTIEQLEKDQPEGKFPNRSALWAAVEETEWAKTRQPRPLTSQVAMLLAKKHNLEIATPVGQRGRAKGSGPIPGAGRKKKTLPLHVIESMKLATPKKYHDIVDRVGKGSAKAAIKLKCLDCVCFQKKEIRLCEQTSCGLWAYRPYKDKPVEETSRRMPIPLAEIGGLLT
jgi:hypothetical protein